ncbi:MAG: Na+/H+ antiporter subunit C [Rhodospirillaceae bacterium]|nr:Na+/H+ antiporter subunit C [Rhodospirillaceae bacterium]|tara:strand:- start:589 stop:963 length:375 start_codon:yes stop_codon:yes gene_type:complete
MAFFDQLAQFLGGINHWITIFLTMAGLYIVMASSNMIKKLVGLGIFQTSVYLLYVSPGKIIGGTAPIYSEQYALYSNPLPHVLILTAIVVGVATLALGLAITVRINEEFSSIEEDEVYGREDQD